MKVAVTPLVRAQVVRCFAPADVAVVCAELGEADLPLINNDGERVHLALLHLASGDLEQFRVHLACAKSDWRDTLVAAGLGNVGWWRVLEARGIDCRELSGIAHRR